MSDNKLLISAVASVVIVTLLVSFSRGRRDVFCFHNSDVPAIKKNLPCSDTLQPKTRRTDWKVSTSIPSATHPCNPDETTFQNAGNSNSYCLPVSSLIVVDH